MSWSSGFIHFCTVTPQTLCSWSPKKQPWELFLWVLVLTTFIWQPLLFQLLISLKMLTHSHREMKILLFKEQALSTEDENSRVRFADKFLNDGIIYNSDTLLHLLVNIFTWFVSVFLTKSRRSGQFLSLICDLFFTIINKYDAFENKFFDDSSVWLSDCK